MKNVIFDTRSRIRAHLTLATLTIFVITAVAFGASQIVPSAPTNLRIVTGGLPGAGAPLPPPLSPSLVPVRADHPRLHFTPETLPRWRSWLADPMKTSFQSYVTRTGALIGNPSADTYRGLDADLHALVWVAGPIAGIDYGAGRTPATFAQAAVDLIRVELAKGVPPISDQIYNAVNHPFHNGDMMFEAMARAYDWLQDYPGFTEADKQGVANYLMEVCRILLEEPWKGKPRMDWNGKGDALDGSPGSESHFPWYYVLAIAGDRRADETRVRQILSTFETHWLNGAWLDVSHFESLGAGSRSMTSYSTWYPHRLIVNFHGWKTATGQDYFNSATPISPDPAYFRNYPLTYALLQKPQTPNRMIPLGQASGDDTLPTITMRALTGVLTGQPARLARALGGTPTINSAAYGLLELLTFDPTIEPEPLPETTLTHFRTYGTIVDRRADQTILTMGAPIIRLRGHTWQSKGGGPKEGIPLGVTLQVNGVPVLVKHVGAHRGANKAFGQNAIRVFDPTIDPEVNQTHWLQGGGFAAPNANSTPARRIHQIQPSHYLGGITGWTDHGTTKKAVADLTRWYDAKFVSAYTRTYEWGARSLRVIDEITTARPDILVWSRWYTGHVPTIGGMGVPAGFSEHAAPSAMTLGPVTWQVLDKPAGTVLKVVGGPDYEWVDDLDNLWKEPSDAGVLKSEGPLEIGTYTITFKAVGSGRWEHLFTW